MTGLEGTELANVILIGLLTGNDVAVWTVVHPALDSIPVSQAFPAERAMLLRYKVQVPILILLILVSGIAVALQTSGSRFWLAVAGTLCVFGWQLIVISLYPINIKVMEAAPDEIPAESDWRRMRRTWFQRHTIRVGLSVGAFVVFILSALRI